MGTVAASLVAGAVEAEADVLGGGEDDDVLEEEEDEDVLAEVWTTEGEQLTDEQVGDVVVVMAEEEEEGSQGGEAPRRVGRGGASMMRGRGSLRTCYVRGRRGRLVQDL